MTNAADPLKFKELKTVYCPRCGFSNLSWREKCQECGAALAKPSATVTKIKEASA